MATAIGAFITAWSAFGRLFGSHLAMVMRRLRRLAAYYGSRPQFVACSATIGTANPSGRLWNVRQSTDVTF